MKYLRGEQMKKNKGYLNLIAGSALFAALFLFPDAFAKGIANGLSACGNVLIPSLFPFLIAASLAGCGSIPHSARKILDPLTKTFFSLPSDCLPAIILGQLGGYLSGPKAAQSLYSGGTISKAQAERLLLFSVNAGLGFSVNAVGNGMLNSRQAGRVLLAALCISSLFLGVISRFFIEEKTDTLPERVPKNPPFSAAVVNSVASGAQAMLTACGFVVIFSGIGSASAGLIHSDTLRIALSCLLEVTGGCADISGKASLPVIAAVCAFGGLCVHMQIFAIARETKISLLRFYLFRLLHAVFAYITCKIVLHFHPVTLPVSLSIYPNAEIFSFSAPAAISLLFLCALLILDLDNNRKIC